MTGLPIRTTLTRPRERDATAGSVWGYQPRPGSPPPSREVLRFVQSLDLSASITNPRRDLQNGYLVAEMLARFYPVSVHMFCVRLAMSCLGVNVVAVLCPQSEASEDSAAEHTQGEVRMFSFANGTGEHVRRDNWEQVRGLVGVMRVWTGLWAVALAH